MSLLSDVTGVDINVGNGTTSVNTPMAGRMIGDAVKGIFGGHKGGIDVPGMAALPGADDREKRYMDQIKALQMRAQGMQGAGADAQVMAQQGLMQRAQGLGPSAADLQLQAGQDRNLQQAMAMQASQRGVNPLLAQRQAMQGLAQQNQGMQAQAGALRAQEQMGAQQQLMQGGLQQQQLQQTQAMQLQDLAKQYEMMGLTQAQAQMQAQQAMNQMQMQVNATNAARDTSMMGGLLSGVGGLAGLMFGGSPAAAQAGATIGGGIGKAIS